MTVSMIEAMLDVLNIGFTMNINGKAVTRWSFDSYEVGTWGKTKVEFAEAVELIR